MSRARKQPKPSALEDARHDRDIWKERYERVSEAFDGMLADRDAWKTKADALKSAHDILSERHTASVDALENAKVQIRTLTEKHAREIADLRAELSELYPVIARLFAWKVKNPFA